MLRDHRAQLRDLKAAANKSGRENVDPGSATGADKENLSARSIYSPLRISRVVFFFIYFIVGVGFVVFIFSGRVIFLSSGCLCLLVYIYIWGGYRACEKIAVIYRYLRNHRV